MSPEHSCTYRDVQQLGAECLLPCVIQPTGCQSLINLCYVMLCYVTYCCEVNQRLTENVVATRRIAAHRHDVGVISSDHDQRVVIVSQRNSSFDSLVERDHLFQCVLGLRLVMAVIYASTCTHPSVVNQHKLHFTSISRAFLGNSLNVFALTSWNVPTLWYGNTDTRYYRFHISDN